MKRVTRFFTSTKTKILRICQQLTTLLFNLLIMYPLSFMTMMGARWLHLYRSWVDLDDTVQARVLLLLIQLSTLFVFIPLPLIFVWNEVLTLFVPTTTLPYLIAFCVSALIHIFVIETYTPPDDE